jgi:hypothetical protein
MPGIAELSAVTLVTSTRAIGDTNGHQQTPADTSGHTRKPAVVMAEK